LNVEELMRVHVEVLFTHDASGDLDRVNEPDGAPAPRFFLGRTPNGVVRRFRGDVDQELRRELVILSTEEILRDQPIDAATDAAPDEQILTRAAPVKRVWAGPAFSFPDDLRANDEATLVTAENASLLEPLLAAWLPDVPICQPMAALIVGGRAVAVCCSGRRTGTGHEAAVETAPMFRRRGYGAEIVPGWARAVREVGRVPLYSTSWQNEGSLALARHLGLIQFGNDVHIT
jgi:hypothetical protein